MDSVQITSSSKQIHNLSIFDRNIDKLIKMTIEEIDRRRKEPIFERNNERIMEVKMMVKKEKEEEEEKEVSVSEAKWDQTEELNTLGSHSEIDESYISQETVETNHVGEQSHIRSKSKINKILDKSDDFKRLKK